MASVEFADFGLLVDQVCHLAAGVPFHGENHTQDDGYNLRPAG